MERKQSRLVVMAAAMAVSLSARVGSADLLTWDSSSSAGIQTSTGTWDLGTTSNWTTDDGQTRITWTSNSDIARFVMPGSGTITVSDANGDVGAYGLQFSGTGSAGTMYMVGSDSSALYLGAGGIVVESSSQVVQTMNSGKTQYLPIVLTASQTWSTTNLRVNSNGAGFRAYGAISSVGITNLTIDGRGLANAYDTGNSSNRAAITLGGNNSFTGTTTVTGGAALWLDYTNESGSRLDDNRALILAGGSVVLNGGSEDVEYVGSTIVDSGANSIYAGANGGGGTRNRISLGTISHNISGTLDITVAVSGIASTTTTNTNGILGGWATMGGGSSWAMGSADGSETNITNTGGTDRSSSATWAENLNVNVTASESNIASRTINALRIRDVGEGIALADDATLTITSGGIIGANSNQYIDGGSLTSGSGALYVHTPQTLTIGSAIVDSGDGAVALVKAAAGTLTLAGDSSHTGGTYVNAGTLLLDGSLASGNITITSGSFAGSGMITFNIEGDSADLISIAEGAQFDPSGLTLNLAISGTQTLGEYVLADNAAGFLAGTTFQALLVNGQSSDSWTIDYDGTEANPGRVVLVVPEPGTIGVLAGVALTALSLRKRRTRA